MLHAVVTCDFFCEKIHKYRNDVCDEPDRATTMVNALHHHHHHVVTQQSASRKRCRWFVCREGPLDSRKSDNFLTNKNLLFRLHLWGLFRDLLHSWSGVRHQPSLLFPRQQAELRVSVGEYLIDDADVRITITTQLGNELSHTATHDKGQYYNKIEIINWPSP